MRLKDYEDTEGIVEPEELEPYPCPKCGSTLTPDDEEGCCEVCGYNGIEVDED